MFSSRSLQQILHIKCNVIIITEYELRMIIHTQLNVRRQNMPSYTQIHMQTQANTNTQTHTHTPIIRMHDHLELRCSVGWINSFSHKQKKKTTNQIKAPSQMLRWRMFEPKSNMFERIFECSLRATAIDTRDVLDIQTFKSRNSALTTFCMRFDNLQLFSATSSASCSNSLYNFIQFDKRMWHWLVSV